MIEALLLTGGAGRRMRCDKALLEIDGVPMARRIASSLRAAGYPVTALGPTAPDGCTVQPDAEPGAGPVPALAGFRPSRAFVFVAACDLARFDAGVVEALRARIGAAQAAVPVIEGREQPLCGLYRAEAWVALRRLASLGERRLRAWLQAVPWEPVPAGALRAAGLDARCVLGANTPEELAALLADSPAKLTDSGQAQPERP